MRKSDVSSILSSFSVDNRHQFQSSSCLFFGSHRLLPNFKDVRRERACTSFSLSMMDQLSATGGVKDEKCKGKITEKHVRGMIQFNMQNPIQQQNSEEQECNNNMNLMVDLIRGCLHLLFFFGNNIRITLNVLLSYIITRFFFWQSSKNHLISIFHLNSLSAYETA